MADRLGDKAPQTPARGKHHTPHHFVNMPPGGVTTGNRVIMT